MVDRADNQSSRATNTFSPPNWPPPDIFQAAKRARGRALRDMILAFVKWAKSGTTDQLSQGAVNTDALRVSPKR